MPAGARHSAPCLLLAVPENESVADFERFLAHHAVMVVALALLRERVVDATERRLGGSLLGAGLAGRIEGEELLVRLAPFGLGEKVAVLLLAVEDPDRLEPRLDAILDRLGARALITTVATSRRRLLCAVLAADSRDGAALLELAARARDELARDGGGEVRAAISGGAAILALRRSFHEARCALEIGAVANGSGAAVASAEDLGAYRLLLALQDDDGLRQYCDDVLTPIERARSGNGEELLRSLEAFLEHNGSWEAAARSLFCHRHTLRYRMARIEELTGRRLDRVENRIEFWLALRGRELLGMPSRDSTQGGAAVRVGIPSETKSDEYRVSMVPAGVRELAERGHEVIVEAGAGTGAGYSDSTSAPRARRSPPTPTRSSPRPT